MASRINGSTPHRFGVSPCQKVEIDELVDLIAARTGLDEAEIRQVLLELGDTEIYLQSPESAFKTGRFGSRFSED